MPSLAAATLFHCSQPCRPSVIQVTSPPPDWHISLGMGGTVLHAVAGFTCTSVLAAFVLGGTASASYQPMKTVPPPAPPAPPAAPPLPPVSVAPPVPVLPPVAPPEPPS